MPRLTRVTVTNYNLTNHAFQDAEAEADECQQMGDWARWYYLQRTLQTANGRYHVRGTNLNDAVNQNEATRVRPTRFRDWLLRVWGAPYES